MLDLIEQQLATPSQVQGLLLGFNGYPRIQRYLRKRILRRALDPESTMGRYFPTSPNWSAVNTGLEAIADLEKRLAALREIAKKHPDDPQGKALLVTLLAKMNRNDEAIRMAERLRRDGLATLRVMEVLCDLQAAAGRYESAKRICSELVEFNATDPVARKRLGDIFLRHKWYEAAYRQYAGLVDMAAENPVALLRLAAAAAGMGKVDEALRIERKVAAGDGEPGPNDPRRFARLHSAAKLARMLNAARQEKKQAKAGAIERSLKQTQIFVAPTTIVLLVWEDLEAPLYLVPKLAEEPFTVTEMVNAEETGLVMMDLGQTPPKALNLVVEFQNEAFDREVSFTMLTIAFDGKTFSIEETQETISQMTV